MKAWNTVRHSIQQVFGNLQNALRVSIVIYTGYYLLTLFLFPSALLQDQAALTVAIQDGTFPWGSLFILMFVMLIGFTWIIVSWHRYVLLEEQVGFVPKFHADRILAYVGVSFKIGLILIPAFILTGILGAGFAMMGTGAKNAITFGMMTSAVAMIPVIILGYRLSILLPATAIGRPLTIAQGWRAMDGQMGMLAMLALFTTILTMAISLLGFMLFDQASNAATVYQFVAGWIQMMFGASVATTIYGVYVENRKLGFS